MPAIRKIIPRRGSEFWESLDPDNMKQVSEAVMVEYNRSEPDHVHYFAGDSWVSAPCFRDCQIFLLHGAFHIEGQGAITETGCSYLVKNEEWIGLLKSKPETVIIVMEEGEQRGACRKRTQEWQKEMLAK